ncbi:MAG: LCP family protein [Sporichthyaceae bacterium]
MTALPTHRRTQARHVARRRPLRRLLTALLVTFSVLLVTGSVGAFVAYYKFNSNIQSQDLTGLLGNRPKVIAEAADQKPLNILLIGSDKRTGVAAQHIAGARSDTTILLHLAADRKTAVLVSIPRDSVVDIPSCKRPDGSRTVAQTTRFNAAYALAGPACTIMTVERITDIRIDHHVVIDFRGFRQMVDALGGVQICLPQRVDDDKSKLHLDAGRQTVHGRAALAYVRTRYQLGNGSDLGRIDRQQAFLSSMVAKVSSKGLLLRPDRALAFLNAATKSITTDPGLASVKDLYKLAQSVKGMDTNAVTFVTVPNGSNPADGGNTVLIREAEADALWSSLRFDRPLPGQEKKPDATAAPQTGPPLRTPPERIRVEVLNGSGVPGAATRLAERLSAAGFIVTRVGTADRDNYTTTTVRHDPAYNESGRTLNAAISGSTIQVDTALSNTLVVVVGTDNPKVLPVQVSGSTATPQPQTSIVTRKASQDICT